MHGFVICMCSSMATRVWSTSCIRFSFVSTCKCSAGCNVSMCATRCTSRAPALLMRGSCFLLKKFHVVSR